MGDLIDFLEKKQIKDNENTLEDNYLKFLSYINKLIPTPKNIDQGIEVIYYVMRYLEGTTQAISLLVSLGVVKDHQKVKELKQMLIPWIENLLEMVKSI